MKIQVQLRQRLILIALPLLLLACQEQQPSVVGGPAKTQAYYAAHANEAKIVAEKCQAFESNAFSAMAPSKQKAWAETDDGISCNNAMRAQAVAIWNDRQRRLRESAAKYGQ
jgi:hypothetical protein